MKEDKVTTCLGLIFSLIVVTVVGALMQGWALSKVWNWFMPAIFNLTALSLWKAVGVATVFELFTGTNRTKKNDDDSKSDTVGEAIVKSLIQVTVAPLVTVFIAWIVFQLAF